MDPRQVTPYFVVALVAWAFYRRMRRSFGRQRVRDRLMWVRIVLLTAVTTLAVVGFARHIDVLGALLAGIVCGAALAYVGLRHTKFEITPAGRFYTPHTYIGLVVTALFAGRLLYRFLGVYNGGGPAANQGLVASYEHAPITLAVFGVLVGYYVLYYLGVLQRTRPGTSLSQETGATDAPGQ